MLIETHAHLDFPKFVDDLDEVVQRAKDAGVEKIINITSCRRDFARVREIVEKYDNIWQSIGIHPHDTEQLKDTAWVDEVKKYAQSDLVVAIGEIGLDYFQMPTYAKASAGRRNTRAEQKKLFVRQLEIAEEIDLPVILHIRDSHDDVYNIVKDRNLRAVVHCFSGNLGRARQFLELGYLISFTGIITFPKTEELARVVRDIPLTRVMIETDSPFLAPQRVRGQRCEPAYVKDVAEKIAEIKNLTFAEVATQTTKNAEDFFRI